MIDTSPSIAKLQSEWHSLPDLDRARAIYAVQQSGVSTREIALQLNVSESLLRHLLQALQAPPEDRCLAHQGKISTNELVRRAKAAGTRRTGMHREALELERAQASQKGCRSICDWLAAEEISGPSGVQIVGEARRQLATAEETNQLPRDAAPPGMPTAMIIQRCRPAELETDAISFVTRFAHWLSLWAAYSMIDSWVRYKAIELALEKQLRR
jgi:hypothetical protein